MSTTGCSRCGTIIDCTRAAMSATGLICQSCELREQQADQIAAHAYTEPPSGGGSFATRLVLGVGVAIVVVVIKLMIRGVL